MKAFHIDRTGLIQPNTEITLLQAEGLTDPVLEDALNKNYPHGLSFHGRTYFTENPLCDHFGIEAIFEYERRLHYPDLPSRFESFFGVETLEELLFRWYPRLLPLFENGQVWELEFEHDHYARVDAEWLNYGTPQSFWACECNARSYWSGARSESPLMEMIIKPPLKAIRQVIL